MQFNKQWQNSFLLCVLSFLLCSCANPTFTAKSYIDSKDHYPCSESYYNNDGVAPIPHGCCGTDGQVKPDHCPCHMMMRSYHHIRHHHACYCYKHTH